MSMWWKIALPAAVLVPAAAFAGGVLTSPSPEQEQRSPIHMTLTDQSTGNGTEKTPLPSPSQTARDGRDDDRDDRDDADDSNGADGPDVVYPDPDDMDDDRDVQDDDIDDDDDGGDDDGDDDEGDDDGDDD